MSEHSFWLPEHVFDEQTDYPEHQRGQDRDGWASLLVIEPDGSILKYKSGPHPVRFPPQNFAVGSGADFALAAMFLCYDAAYAVKVACELDSGCGNGIDSIMLDDQDDA